MADERNYFVLCEDNCKFPAMTKEQVLSAIAEATGATVKDIDSAFITKVKEKNGGASLTFWVGTQAEYNAIEKKVDNCLYLVTDETTGEDIDAALQANAKDIQEALTGIKQINARKGGKLLYSAADNLANAISPSNVGQTIDGLSNYSVIICYVSVEIGSHYCSNAPVLMVTYNSGSQRNFFGFQTNLVDYTPTNELLHCYFEVNLQVKNNVISSMGGYVKSASDYNNSMKNMRIERIIGIS